jgi:hypothetical protein
MYDDDEGMPPERKRQFDLIAVATAKTLQWAHDKSVILEHIEPIVPFVETDFSLEAWLFLDTEARIEQYSGDGTVNALIAQFRAELGAAGYPADWLEKVTCKLGSKEVVDRDYNGSYYYFLR